MPGRPGQLDHGVAGDPFEDAGVDRRGVQLAAADEEDVVAGALGDLALVVEHQGFEAAGVGPLDLGQDVVQVVERLDPRVERARVVAHRAGGDDLQAVLVELGGIEADGVGDDDDLRVGRLARVEAEAAGAAGDDEADVAVGQLVDGQGLDDRLRPSRLADIGICRWIALAESKRRSTCSLSRKTLPA